MGMLRAEYDNNMYDDIVISSLFRILFVKPKHHYLSFP